MITSLVVSVVGEYVGVWRSQASLCGPHSEERACPPEVPFLVLELEHRREGIKGSLGHTAIAARIQHRQLSPELVPAPGQGNPGVVFSLFVSGKTHFMSLGLSIPKGLLVAEWRDRIPNSWILTLSLSYNEALT